MTTRINAKAAAIQRSNNRTWYSIKAKSGEAGAPIEVSIYDEIGLWGISAASFIADIRAVDDGKVNVVVGFNTPGGDLFDGFAIHNFLAGLGERCTGRIDGLAASAGSVAVCGCHNVVIAENAMMMIHNPWTFAYGTAEDLRKTADMMDKAREGILASYRRKAPSIEDADLIKMLDDETWLNAEEAVALGFADAIGDSVTLQACCGATGVLARFKHPPKAILESVETAHDDAGNGEQEQETENTQGETGQEEKTEVSDARAVTARLAVKLIDACVSAGIPEIAKELLMTTTLNDEAAMEAETKRIKDIGALCVTAKMPELTADYVKSGLSAEAVRARLFDRIVAANEGEEINNKEQVGKPNGKPKAKTPNAKAIYASRKKQSK